LRGSPEHDKVVSHERAAGHSRAASIRVVHSAEHLLGVLSELAHGADGSDLDEDNAFVGVGGSPAGQ